MPLTSWVSLDKLLNLSGPLCTLSVKWSHLPISLEKRSRVEDWGGAWETVPDSTDLQEDLCHLVKPTQGDSSQLQFVFSLQPVPQKRDLQDPGEPKHGHNQGCPVSVARRSLQACPPSRPQDDFQQLSSLRVSSEAKLFAATSSPFPNYNRAN